jgi:chitinase
MKGPSIAASLCFGALLAGCATVQPASTHEIVGYYPGWKGRIDFDARRLTVLNYAFLDICWDGRHGNPAVEKSLAPCLDAEGAPIAAPNGSLVLGHPPFDAPNLAYLPTLKRANPKLKLVASVGGWSWSNRFSDMASDVVARAAFVSSAVALLRRHGLDGLDIDWEYPGSIGIRCAEGRNNCDRADDKENFVALARALRAAFDDAGTTDGKRYLLTVAAGADAKFVLDRGSGGWLVRLARSLDWINLMTYDYHGTWERAAGFVAPLHADPADPGPANADSSVALFLEAGVPASKLALGMPFYGKGWSGCAPGPRGDGLYQPCTGLARESHEATFEFAYLVDEGYLVPGTDGRYTRGGLGFTRHWNAAAGTPYLYNPATQVFISYDDEASIGEKTRYAIRQGLRGVMFWELDADRHGVLGNALGEGMQMR